MDVWDIDWWFIRTVKSMIEDFKSVHWGVQQASQMMNGSLFWKISIWNVNSRTNTIPIYENSLGGCISKRLFGKYL